MSISRRTMLKVVAIAPLVAATPTIALSAEWGDVLSEGTIDGKNAQCRSKGGRATTVDLMIQDDDGKFYSKHLVDNADVCKDAIMKGTYTPPVFTQ